jgi:hypothetical protein
VSIDDKLATAATSIGSMPEDSVTEHLGQLEAAHRRRDSLAAARHQSEVDSLDLDWAAYQLACQHDDAGDLAAAARCYRMAAANDFADAALRLGTVLEMLADQRAASTEPGYYASQREQLALVSDAARWYAEAYAAGHPEAAERLDGMISRHDTRNPHARDQVMKAPGLAPERCQQGGLDTVLNGSDLTTATTHFRHCTACQYEFLDLGGLLPTPQTRTTHCQAISSPGPAAERSCGSLVKELTA